MPNVDRLTLSVSIQGASSDSASPLVATVRVGRPVR